MSRFLERLREVSAEYPEKEAFFNSRIKEDACQRLTYAELDAWSDSLAASFAEWSPKGKPVVVYGHKSPLMLVCFIAAAKAGLTYAPVDIAYPSDRVNDILDQIGHPLVITLSDDEFPGDASLADSVVGDAVVREAALAGRSCSSARTWRACSLSLRSSPSPVRLRSGSFPVGGRGKRRFGSTGWHSRPLLPL